MTDLARALDVALRAARAAGGLLRAELFRPDGPRGEPGHCPADAEAEDLIRAMLDAAFPGHGLIGEERPERNRAPARPGGPCWLVDPNDGTADFQRGHRGASVSIGLVQDGVPVLGVVLAHTAPHGGEDLLAWAEGEGPVRRNGAPVPPISQAPLAAGEVVLVSSSAAKRARGNSEAVQPARFRPLTSIAYRLALVASGDARGAISLHRPRALDIAAGHALVRGAGGVLLDEAGREVRYGPSGEGRVSFCFGGAPAVAARLAGRSWVEAQAYGPGAPGMCAPLAGRAIRDDGLLRRAQGALLGQLAGDALGAQVEFSSRERIAAAHPGGVRELADGGHWSTLAGQPTDDSELALALARTVVAFGRFDAARVAEAYADWLASEPFDVGRTIDAALRPALRMRAAGAGSADVAAAARAAASRDSLANGALMRVSPLGIAGHASPPEEVAAWARADAALTHPAATCQDASAVYAATLAYAVASGAPAAEVADRGEGLAAELGCGRGVCAVLAAARAGPPGDFETSAGLVAIALQNAFFHLRHAPDVERALVDTVGGGGDTDTNAAIAGALLGAVHGVLGIPERWRRAVLTCWPVEGAPGVRRPRPPVCWPGDALIVAERLLGL